MAECAIVNGSATIRTRRQHIRRRFESAFLLVLHSKRACVSKTSYPDWGKQRACDPHSENNENGKKSMENDFLVDARCCCRRCCHRECAVINCDFFSSLFFSMRRSSPSSFACFLPIFFSPKPCLVRLVSVCVWGVWAVMRPIHLHLPMNSNEYFIFNRNKDIVSARTVCLRVLCTNRRKRIFPIFNFLTEPPTRASINGEFVEPCNDLQYFFCVMGMAFI